MSYVLLSHLKAKLIEDLIRVASLKWRNMMLLTRRILPNLKYCSKFRRFSYYFPNLCSVPACFDSRRKMASIMKINMAWHLQKVQSNAIIPNKHDVTFGFVSFTGFSTLRRTNHAKVTYILLNLRFRNYFTYWKCN